MKMILLVLILGIGGPALAQQMGQWGQDNQLWTVVNNRWQPSGVCRMPQPGKPTAFLVYQCTDRNRILFQVDLKQVRITGWVYVNSVDGKSHFRYRSQGEVFPDPRQWYVWANGNWQFTAAQLAAAQAPVQAPVAQPGYVRPTSITVGGTPPPEFIETVTMFGPAYAADQAAELAKRTGNQNDPQVRTLIDQLARAGGSKTGTGASNAANSAANNFNNLAPTPTPATFDRK